MRCHPAFLLLLLSACADFQPAIDASRAHAERVRWPDTYRPEDASFFVHNELAIQAPPEVVWEVLLEAETWPDWYAGARDVQVRGGDRLHDGAVFTWTTMGLDFTSTVREFEPPHRLAWESQKDVIQGWHAWLIIPEGDGCVLVTDEAQHGMLTFFEWLFVPNDLSELHDQWLAAIAERARGRHEALKSAGVRPVQRLNAREKALASE